MRRLVRLLCDLAILVVFNVTMFMLVVVAILLLSWWGAYFDLTPADPDRPALWKLLVLTPIIVAAGVIAIRSIFSIGGRLRDAMAQLAST